MRCAMAACFCQLHRFRYALRPPARSWGPMPTPSITSCAIAPAFVPARIRRSPDNLRRPRLRSAVERHRSYARAGSCVGDYTEHRAGQCGGAKDIRRCCSNSRSASWACAIRRLSSALTRTHFHSPPGGNAVCLLTHRSRAKERNKHLRRSVARISRCASAT